MKRIFILLIMLFMLSGCLNNEKFEDKYTYTTIYPVEFATKSIYSGYSNISSIYPSGTDIKEYKLTEKQLNKYAKGETFVYNGLGNEAPIARDLLNLNSNIQIIDATKGMSYTYNIAELWLDPSNYLMISRNIKSSLIDYTENIYTKEEIEKNYTSLKEEISELDVDLYNIGKNKNYSTLLVTSNMFNYLTKYGIEIISLDSTNTNIDKLYSDAKKLIDKNSIKYIYTIKDEKLDEKITKLIQNNSLEKLEINTMLTITDEQRKNSISYITIMEEILDAYKKELYK